MVTSKGNVATIMSEMQRLLSISKAGIGTMVFLSFLLVL